MKDLTLAMIPVSLVETLRPDEAGEFAALPGTTNDKVAVAVREYLAKHRGNPPPAAGGAELPVFGAGQDRGDRAA
jgi:hypothetical protein